MDTRSRSIRILMFPWLAHGHISPFLQLAKSLANRNFITYMCSSQVNLNHIKKNLSSKESISIKLVDLHIPATPELPPHYHTTNGLPPNLMSPLKRALDQARPSFSTILHTLKPDLVLYDFLQPWAPEEAASRGIPAVLFFSTGAATISLLAHHMLGSSLEYPFPAIYFRENEYHIFSRLVKCNETHDDARVRECIYKSSDIILVKSFREIEGKYIDFLSELTHKKFVPVGPLVPDVGQNHEENDDNSIIEWLDRRDGRSTVFASFGSEYFLSENEVEEIAYGLEMSGVNFVWALRFPVGERIKMEEKLPEGFADRVKERGLVVEGWVPQRQILSHPSVGGFMSHCGWSSVMEGLYSGVPIIAVPMHLDQPLNARLVVEGGFGEEAVRNRAGRLEREEVARAVGRVTSGEEVRRRVSEINEKMREKGEEEVEGVVEEMAKLYGKYEKERENGLESENSMEMLSENA